MDEVARGKEFFGEGYDYRNPRGYDFSIDSKWYSVDAGLKIIRGFLLQGQREPRQLENVPLA